MNIFESWNTPKSPKEEKGFEYDMEKDGIAWEPQPEAKRSFGMPEEPSAKGIKVEELDAEGRDQFQQRKVIEGITYDRTPVTEEELLKSVEAMDAFEYEKPTEAEIAEVEKAILMAKGEGNSEASNPEIFKGRMPGKGFDDNSLTNQDRSRRAA
jgi:hypothetical protein